MPLSTDLREDQRSVLEDVVRLLQAIVDVPLCIDSSVPGALEKGLEAAEGRPLARAQRRLDHLGLNLIEGPIKGLRLDLDPGRIDRRPVERIFTGDEGGRCSLCAIGYLLYCCHFFLDKYAQDFITTSRLIRYILTLIASQLDICR